MLKKSILTLIGCLFLLGMDVVFAASNDVRNGTALSVVHENTYRADMFFTPGATVQVTEATGKTRTIVVEEPTKFAEGDTVTKIVKGGMSISAQDKYSIQTLSQGLIVINKNSCAVILVGDDGKVSKVIVVKGSATFGGSTIVPVSGVIIPSVFKIGPNIIEASFHTHFEN
jgi:hypothetical protein